MFSVTFTKNNLILCNYDSLIHFKFRKISCIVFIFLFIYLFIYFLLIFAIRICCIMCETMFSDSLLYKYISKFFLFQIKICHKFVSSQKKFINNFIHFKLIKVLKFFIFYKSLFFLATNSTFPKSINLFGLVFLTLVFLLAINLLQLRQ